MLNRRTFLKNSAAAAVLAAIPGSLFAADDTVKITVLHTNDMHSRIEPFPANSGLNSNMGGMERRAALIKQIREKEKNVLLLDAGDVFQGTPYFNYFGGELEFKLMSQMKYDACTIGNHDFDNGLEGFKKMLPHAQFPFLISNYDFSRTILKDTFEPYKIFTIQGIKVGVFGIGIELKGLVADNLYGNTVYRDPVATAKEMVETLKKKDCNLIICLSHLGYRYKEEKISDVKLAEQVDGIDLIIGGHTHTFLDKPVTIKSPSGNEIIINQVGWAGINIGRIDFTFQRKLKQNAALLHPINVS
jgi:5'-nucleotidase